MYKYLILNHIPRCGGSSLRKSFFEAASSNQYFNRYPIYVSSYSHNNISLYNTPELVPAIHQDTLLFIDHSPFSFIERAFNLENSLVYRITTLRNPLSRIISHINFFYNQPLDSITQTVLDFVLDTVGHLTIYYLTRATSHQYKSLTEKTKIASSILKDEYHFIFKVEEQKLLETFNDNNPFNLQLENYHINQSSGIYNVNTKIQNYIYKKIKNEYKLLENFYDLDFKPHNKSSCRTI